MEIVIRINGKDERRKAGTIAELVAGRGLAPGSLVVEYNGRIIKQDDWVKVMLRQGDELELLNFVGGG
ncbi:MAG: thiamine biosynthesis protein ThiS [Desulfobulbaceae bacterium BRH_c16a]|nr:MAG: thiamine biosynthesis protein ThiS [Desulfobulbaceae bacterium BRH_c16a]